MSQSHVNDEGFREFVAGRYGDLLRTAYLLTGGRQSAMRDLYALPTCLCRSYRYTDGMRQPTYFILAALQDGPLHGYAIISRVDDLSGGQTKLATGTLYAALDRPAATTSSPQRAGTVCAPRPSGSRRRPGSSRSIASRRGVPCVRRRCRHERAFGATLGAATAPVPGGLPAGARCRDAGHAARQRRAGP
jgi:hypothetical protein